MQILLEKCKYEKVDVVSDQAGSNKRRLKFDEVIFILFFLLFYFFAKQDENYGEDDENIDINERQYFSKMTVQDFRSSASEAIHGCFSFLKLFLDKQGEN